MNDGLEAMIDKVGLSKVLFLLAEVCDGKAEHLRSNWQDANAAIVRRLCLEPSVVGSVAEALAKEWTADAKAIEKLAARIRST